MALLIGQILWMFIGGALEVLQTVDLAATDAPLPSLCHRTVAPGCQVRHDLLPLSSMIRGVLSPVLVVSVDR